MSNFSDDRASAYITSFDKNVSKVNEWRFMMMRNNLLNLIHSFEMWQMHLLRAFWQRTTFFLFGFFLPKQCTGWVQNVLLRSRDKWAQFQAPNYFYMEMLKVCAFFRCDCLYLLARGARKKNRCFSIRKSSKRAINHLANSIIWFESVFLCNF